jgi:hypothetical protein
VVWRCFKSWFLVVIVSYTANNNIFSVTPCQVEDLSRMFRLYHKVTRGLEPVSNVFKQVGWHPLFLLFCYQKSPFIMFFFLLLILPTILNNLPSFCALDSILLLKEQPWSSRQKTLRVARFVAVILFFALLDLNWHFSCLLHVLKLYYVRSPRVLAFFM